MAGYAGCLQRLIDNKLQVFNNFARMALAARDSSMSAVEFEATGRMVELCRFPRGGGVTPAAIGRGLCRRELPLVNVGVAGLAIGTDTRELYAGQIGGRRDVAVAFPAGDLGMFSFEREIALTMVVVHPVPGIDIVALLATVSGDQLVNLATVRIFMARLTAGRTKGKGK